MPLEQCCRLSWITTGPYDRQSFVSLTLPDEDRVTIMVISWRLNAIAYEP